MKSTLDSKLVDHEDQLLAWNDLIEQSKTVGDVENQQGSSKYFSDITTFHQEFNFDSLEAPGTYMHKAEEKLKYLEGEGTSDPSWLRITLSELTYLNAQLKGISDAIDVFEKSVKALNGYSSLRKGPSVLEPFEKMIHLIKIRGSFQISFTDESKTAIGSSLKLVLGLSSDSKTVSKGIQTANDLSESISMPRIHQKKFTSGFMNGLSDLKLLEVESRDPWIGKMTGAEGERLGNLANGLEPLFKVQEQLNGLDVKLKPISSRSILLSMSKFKTLSTYLSNLDSSSSEKVGSLLDELKKCNGKRTLLPNEYESSEKVVETAKKLKALSENANAALEGLDTTQIKATIDGVMKSLGFQDFESQAAKDIDSVMDNIKNKNGFKSIRENIKQLKTRFANIPKSLKDEVKTMIDDSTKLNIFSEEVGVHKCLQKLTDDSANVSLGVLAAQKIRNLDLDEIKNVETAVSAISQVSKGLSVLKNIPSTMNQGTKDVTTSINEFPDSIAQSKVIGQSVASLHNAYGLKRMESQIAQLASVGASVTSEIQKIQNPEERKKVEKQWGDHKSDISKIQKSLNDIKSFDSKIPTSNTIGQLGNPFKNLVSISSAKINVKEKSKSLKFLISQDKIDPNMKSELEESLKTLEELETLDLDFSSHKNQFRNAPNAFNAFHNDEQDMAMTIIYVGVGVIVLLAILAGSIAYYFCVYKVNKIKKAVMDFIKENRLISAKEAKEKHQQGVIKLIGIRNTGKEKRLRLIPKNKRSGWLAPPLNPDTRVIVNDEVDPYHATRIATRSKIVYVAAEVPLGDSTTGRTVNTCDDFWNLTMDQGSEFIVSCAAYSDRSRAVYYGRKINEVKEFDRFKITTKTKTAFIQDKVTCRELEVEDKSGVYPTRTIKHFHFLKWHLKMIFTEHEPVFEVLKVVNTSKKPVIVHCVRGTANTMVFIGLQYVYEEVLFNPKVKFWDVIRELCEIRWGSFGYKDETMYVLTGVFYQLIKKFKLQMTPYTEDFAIMMECRVMTNKEVDEKYKKRKENGEGGVFFIAAWAGEKQDNKEELKEWDEKKISGNK
ncbi:Protein CBG22553 [Caenorhabditis briggsae]|uniref:Protein CBG22553 n=1 Tax=Caenorhabditis briggsae TaxID=6238 RepID=A8Y2J5_CAEBR|nr:Protein CBG22553 [Caenorhabditis briggsae]CAP39117.2 Protein CBG22553 [Caenorhabditis briggsae]